ncbi:MAG: hypothetical protein HKN23_07370 [Verrucomicrobiales bacterium]|nr:hypothetical protein [Verrucomicrobiales bacterium]
MNRILLTSLSVSVLFAVSGCTEKEPAEEPPASEKSESSATSQPKTAEVAETSSGGPAAPGTPGSPERADAFAAEAGKRVAETFAVQGDDKAWFFLTRELKQAALGKFWEPEGNWAKVAANNTDPVPSMVEFNNLLKERGIELIVVPVPAKASIYPGKLAAGFAPGDPVALAPIFERLKVEGINAIDFEAIAREHRANNPDDKLWCGQDAHYSPKAARMIAELVGKEIGDKVKGDAGLIESPEETLEITGDQVQGNEFEGKVAKETLTIQYAGKEENGKIVPVEPDPESPVLLVGDSHTLVFQEGAGNGMHCRGAGVFDHLSKELDLPLDLVGVRGSGLVQARKQLFFHARGHENYWDKKKVVVWIFSVREFTQSTDNIIKIPLEK